MKWWKQPLRIVHIFPAGSIDKFDAEEYAEKIRKIDANAIHYDAIWEVDYCARYKSKIVEEHPQLGSRDVLDEVINAVHKRDIKIFVYVAGHPVEERGARKHPDWLQVNSNRERIRCYHRYYAGCINSSWGNYEHDIVKEIVENYDIDGIFLDGPAFFENCCYCQNCQRKFKEQFGVEIPDHSNKNSAIWKNFIAWRYACISEYIGRIRDAVHSINSNVIFYSNGIQGLHRLSRLSARDAQRVAEKEDIVGVESFFGFPPKNIACSLWLAGANARYARAVAEDKPRVIFTTYGKNPYYCSPTCKGSLITRLYQAFANGAGAWLEMPHPVLDYSPDEAKVVSKVYRFIKKYENYYQEAESIANVALLWSRQSGDYYGSTPEDMNKGLDFSSKGFKESAGDPSHLYLTSFWGMYDALIRAHIPFDLIVDKNLEDEKILDKYKVIILGNSPCLSNKQNENIKNFVAKGGGLIASYETSLYDEKGNKRNDFALSDLFGVKIRGKKIGPLSNSYIFYENKSKTLLKDTKTLSPSPKYNMDVAKFKDSEVYGYLLVNIDNAGFYDPVRRQLSENKISKNHHFLITNQYKKGRIFYTAGSIGDRYLEGNLPEIKQLTKNAVEWVGRATVPIELPNLSETVEVVLTHQPAKKRSLIHLINLTGQMHFPIEAIIPLYQIKVLIRKKMLPEFNRISLLVADQDVEFEEKNNLIKFTIPRLDAYEIVILHSTYK